MSGKFELFISDLDGTIVETEDYHRLAYNALFSELGLSICWTKQDYIDRLQTMGGNKFREIFSWLGLPEEEFEQTKTNLYAQKTRLYADLITTDLYSGKLRVRPGIKRFFREVEDAGISIAIATACVGWAAEKVLDAALGEGFVGKLASFCGGETTKRKKPFPDIYLLAAERAQTLPQNCLVLEDTAHGVEAAKKAGMVCLATPSEFALGHDFSAADLVLVDLERPRPTTFSEVQAIFCGS